MFQPTDAWMGLFGFNELFIPLVDQLAEVSGDSVVNANSIGSLNDLALQWMFGVNLYLGRRFVSETTLRHGNSTIGEQLVVQGAPGVYDLQANLDFWELVGQMRYNLGTGAFEPYIKGGYGLSWYQLQDATLGGEVLGTGSPPGCGSRASSRTCCPTPGTSAPGSSSCRSARSGGRTSV